MEKLFFNKGFNKGLAPLGKVWSLNLAIAFGKGLLRFWVSRSCSLAQLAAIVNPANKPTKVEMEPLLVQGLGKLWKSCFFNKGLIRDSFLLRKACSLNLAILEKACFSSGLPGAALAQLAAIVNPANKTYSDRDASTGSDREMSKNLTELQRFWEKKCLSAITFFFKKSVLPILFCHESEPSKQYMSFRIIWKNCHNSDPSY